MLTLWLLDNIFLLCISWECVCVCAGGQETSISQSQSLQRKLPCFWQLGVSATRHAYK